MTAPKMPGQTWNVYGSSQTTRFTISAQAVNPVGMCEDTFPLSDHFFHLSSCAQPTIVVPARRPCRYLSNMLYFATRYNLYCTTNHNSRQAAPLCKKPLSHAVCIQDKDNRRQTFRWDWQRTVGGYTDIWCTKPSRDTLGGHIHTWLVCDHTFFLWRTLNVRVGLGKLSKNLRLASLRTQSAWPTALYTNPHNDRNYTMMSASNTCPDCTSISHNTAQGVMILVTSLCTYEQEVYASLMPSGNRVAPSTSWSQSIDAFAPKCSPDPSGVLNLTWILHCVGENHRDAMRLSQLPYHRRRIQWILKSL